MSDKISKRVKKGHENNDGIFQVFTRGQRARFFTQISMMFLLFF